MRGRSRPIILSTSHSPGPVIGAAQAARLLGISYEQMKTRLRKEVYPGRRVGRNWEISLADVERIRGGESAPPATPPVEIPELLRRLLSGEQVRFEVSLKMSANGCEVDVAPVAALAAKNARRRER